MYQEMDTSSFYIRVGAGSVIFHIFNWGSRIHIHLSHSTMSLNISLWEGSVSFILWTGSSLFKSNSVWNFLPMSKGLPLLCLSSSHTKPSPNQLRPLWWNTRVGMLNNNNWGTTRNCFIFHRKTLVFIPAECDIIHVLKVVLTMLLQ